jgi:hypothetical protein
MLTNASEQTDLRFQSSAVMALQEAAEAVSAAAFFNEVFLLIFVCSTSSPSSRTPTWPPSTPSVSPCQFFFFLPAAYQC